MEKEIWKDVPGYEGLYQVSNLGNVKSLDRISNNWQSTVLKKGVILRQGKTKNLYFTVSLSKNKTPKTFYTHVLVAMAFLNHIPNSHELVVDHINNIKTDNRVENLQLVSYGYNCSKDRKNKTSKYMGVFKRKDRPSWISCVSFNKVQIRIMSFKTELEAKKCYDIAIANIDKYKGDKNEFRKLIKSLID